MMLTFSYVVMTVLAVGADPVPAANNDVADVLAALEQAGKNLQTIRAEVEYTVTDTLSLTETTKYGELTFKRADPHPLFLVHFNKLVADDIVRRDKEWWLLRDRWLTEAKGKSKAIIKREVYRAGEAVDFFDLEKSPIPMPFGQKQDEIEKNFAVRLMPPQLGDPPDCDHVYCIPREGSRLAKEYKRLEYYVSRTLHLPVRIVAEDAEGAKVKIARFPKLEAGDINVKLADQVFELPKETRSFNVTEEPLPAATE